MDCALGTLEFVHLETWRLAMGLQELVPYLQGQLELGAYLLKQEELGLCWLEPLEFYWLRLLELDFWL